MERILKPNKLNPTPKEQALLKAAEGINKSLRSRAHLLSIVDGLDLEKASLDVRMVYVLAMLSLGFSKSRALKRLRVSAEHLRSWKRDENNASQLLECEARGGLILEETLLLAAESNPKTALEVLKLKERAEERQEETQKKGQSVEDMFFDRMKERGLVQEGEILEEVPNELN